MEPATPCGLSIRRISLEDLHLDPSNVRTHDDLNLDAISASLTRFGQAEPLVVQASTGRVVGGNGRLTAMRALGWTACDIVELDLDDTQAAALSIALNRTAELAGWDDEGLARMLDQLRSEDALDGVGFDDADIDALLADLDIAESQDLQDPGPPPAPVAPVSRLADIWHLDKHRLLCGDSTAPQDVSRVMNGDLASLVSTDPPYLVDYTGERPNNSGKDWSADYREIDITDADGFFRAVFTNVLSVLAPHAAIYCWHAHKRSGLIQSVWHDLGILDHQQIVWVKPTSVFGRVYWHFRHEPCVMGWRKGSQPEHDGGHDHDSVWEIDWEGAQRIVGNEHPTQKPVEIFARPMRKHTKPGDVVFEPFSGSGSQLIAAEQLGRRCRAMEVSPAFVDVAVRRWQEATGKVAMLEGDGRTFDEVKADRLNDMPEEDVR